MGDRRTRRVAWAMSAGLHAGGAAAVWLLAPDRPPPPAPRPDFHLIVEMPAVADDPPPAVVAASPTPPAVVWEPGRPPVAVAPPVRLPEAVAALVRDRVNRPPSPAVVQDVVDVRQASATAPASPPPDTVAGSSSAGSRSPVGDGVGGTPLHPPLAAGRTVVYVLDCSGTMGLDGRLTRATAALLATLAALPDGTRVQLVTYTGRAVPLLPGGLRPLTADTRAAFAAALARLEPAGASRHAEGLRVALLLAPDAVLLLTDADADELADARPLVRGAKRPAAVSVARVTAAGVLPATKLD